MKHGQVLNTLECDAVWETLKNLFSFDLIQQKDNITFDKSTVNTHPFSIEHFWGDAEDHKIPQFLQKAIDAFVTITASGENIYALSWQGDCFLIDPRQLTLRDMVDSQQGQTLPSFIPENRYTMFTTQNFENAWFGDPFSRKITLVGEKLINAFL